MCCFSDLDARYLCMMSKGSPHSGACSQCEFAVRMRDSCTPSLSASTSALVARPHAVSTDLDEMISGASSPFEIAAARLRAIRCPMYTLTTTAPLPRYALDAPLYWRVEGFRPELSNHEARNASRRGVPGAYGYAPTTR